MVLALNTTTKLQTELSECKSGAYMKVSSGHDIGSQPSAVAEMKTTSGSQDNITTDISEPSKHLAQENEISQDSREERALKTFAMDPIGNEACVTNIDAVDNDAVVRCQNSPVVAIKTSEAPSDLHDNRMFLNFKAAEIKHRIRVRMEKCKPNFTEFTRGYVVNWVVRIFLGRLSPIRQARYIIVLIHCCWFFLFFSFFPHVCCAVSGRSNTSDDDRDNFSWSKHIRPLSLSPASNFLFATIDADCCILGDACVEVRRAWG